VESTTADFSPRRAKHKSNGAWPNLISLFCEFASAWRNLPR
jgi:hypothetical protein